jgi:hypothetical protein
MTQRKFGLGVVVCVLGLFLCMYLQGKGFPVTGLASVVFVLLCAFILVYFISAVGDGFFAIRGSVVRGDDGVLLALIRLGGILIAGIAMLVIVHSY